MYTLIISALVGFALPWQTRFLFRVPIVGGAVWEFGVISIYVSQVLLALWLAHNAYQNRVRLVWQLRTHLKQRRAQIIFCACILFLVVQLFISADKLLTVLAVINMSLAGGLVTLLYFEKAARKPFFGGFLIAATFQALLGFLQVVMGGTFASTALGMAAHRAADHGAAIIEVAGIRHLRAYGGQPHPNIFGAFMLIALLVYAYMIYTHTEQMQNKNTIQFSVLTTGALFFSFSRSAWLGFLIACVLAWVHRAHVRDGQRTMLRWALGTFAVLTILFLPFVISRAIPQTYIEQRSISERGSELGQWKHVIEPHWFFGTGLWAYTAALDAPTGDVKVPVHDVPLLKFAEVGLFGVLFGLFVFFYSGMRVRLTPLIFIAVPMLIVDHYLYSLWPGLVISVIGISLYLIIAETRVVLAQLDKS